jgi:hypothetical protein
MSYQRLEAIAPFGDQVQFGCEVKISDFKLRLRELYSQLINVKLTINTGYETEMAKLHAMKEMENL